ncbi:MAG TPA: response regulator [Flavisolibacter sp.]|nr:response regulator [Flavisolibacter sp.]
MTHGPIIIIDDDSDDQEIYGEALKAIGINNEVRYFDGGQPALDYLYTTAERPFILLSDINMPQMTGLQLKEIIQKDDFLREKGIPFVFISTNASAAAVRRAHELNVQGYFQKPDNINDIQSMLRKLFDYWSLSKHINNTF